MSRQHALLSASGASKWLNCTPSAKLESTQEQSTSTYADEGTLAHDLAEIGLNYYLGFIDQKKYLVKHNEIEQSEYYSESLEEYVNEYVDYCLEKYNSYKDQPFAAVEETVYLEPFIPGGYSHLDFTVLSDTELNIVDYKHGKGVPVQAEGNKQALIYALGAYLSFSFMAAIETINITIFQPRIENITHWQLSIEDLLQWANTELKEKAALAYEGKGELKAGEWCRFCKAKAKCRAFAEANLELAKIDFETVEAFTNEIPKLENVINNNIKFLTDKEIAAIVQGADMFKNWLNGVLEYALKQALNGKQWPGLKVVHGRSIRRYTDAAKIIEILKAAGYFENDITTKKIKAITELEKLIGKAKLEQVIGEYIVKPEGGPSLVLEIDKRPAYNKTEDAKNDFSNL